LFAELDRPALQPLPQLRYQLAEWKKVRANIDYNVEVDRHFCSVPNQLVGEQLEARFTVSTVEMCASPRIRAAALLTVAPPLPSIAQRATRRTWSRLRRA
jgi:hypothetical protein